MTDVPQVRSARNSDVHLAYQVLGDKPHDLVLVWGGPNHLDLLWENAHLARLLRRFTGFSRLIHFDQRGTGLSDRIPVSELPTLEERAADIEAVMDAAGSERAVILGESDGGLSAMFFAATYPERTAGLALWGTLARGSPDDDYPWAPSPELAQAYLDAMEENWGEPFGIELLFPSLAGDEQFRSWWGRHLRAAASPAAARAFTEMALQTDVRSILPSIHVPTLVMHRTGDMLADVGGARYSGQDRIHGHLGTTVPMLARRILRATHRRQCSRRGVTPAGTGWSGALTPTKCGETPMGTLLHRKFTICGRDLGSSP